MKKKMAWLSGFEEDLGCGNRKLGLFEIIILQIPNDDDNEDDDDDDGDVAMKEEVAIVVVVIIK